MSKKFTLFLVAAAATAGAFYAGLPGPRAGGLHDIAASTLARIAPAAGNEPEVALHKAIYDLNMVSVASGAGVAGIKGEMYFEQDDACDAWTTDQRFNMEYQYPERSAVNNTNHYVAWEGKDGKRFEFNSEREENGQPSELLRGAVLRNDDGTAQAKYTRPPSLSFDLPQGYLLPTQQTNQVIEHARAGDHFTSAILFDGTDADGPVEIDTVIGKKATLDEIKKLYAAKAGKIDDSLLAVDGWHVRMAVFPLKDKDVMTPSYEMDMILHANGVVSYAVVDYKTFKVEQRLKTLERLPPPKC